MPDDVNANAEAPPQPQDQPADSPAVAPPPKRGYGRMVLLIVVVSLSACALAAFGPSVLMWVHMQRWSTSGPLQTADAFRAAVEAGDAKALEAVMADPAMVTTLEDGSLAVGGGFRGQAELPVDGLRCGPADESDLEYVSVAVPPTVRVHLPLAVEGEEGEVRLSLIRQGSGWKIRNIRLRGGAMRGIKGPESPFAAQQGARAAGNTDGDTHADEDSPTTTQAAEPD